MRAQLHGFETEINKQQRNKETAKTPQPVNNECGICLQEPMVNVVVLPSCKHGFCFSCLSRWQEYSKTANCPFCRQSIDKPVDEEALEKASLLTARSRSKHKSLEEKQELIQAALAEVEKVLTIKPNDLLALSLQGQILVDYEPIQAVKVFEATLSVDQQGNRNRTRVSKLLAQREAAERSNNEEGLRKVDEQLDALVQERVNLSQFGSGPARLFDIKILLAEAWEAALEWSRAEKVYRALLGAMDSPEMASPPQVRKIFSGLSRCLYHLKDYKRAIDAAEAAFSMNRHFPGVHRLIALPLLAQGKIDEAKETIGRAILYEAPWDDDAIDSNLALWTEINAGRVSLSCPGKLAENQSAMD